MRDRMYLLLTPGIIIEAKYKDVQSKKPSMIYQSPDVTVLVYGTLKRSRLRRDQVDYHVMLFLQSKGLKVGQMYREK